MTTGVQALALRLCEGLHIPISRLVNRDREPREGWTLHMNIGLRLPFESLALCVLETAINGCFCNAPSPDRLHHPFIACWPQQIRTDTTGSHPPAARSSFRIAFPLSLSPIGANPDGNAYRDFEPAGPSANAYAGDVKPSPEFP